MCLAIAEAAMDEEQPNFGFSDFRDTLRRCLYTDNEATSA